MCLFPTNARAWKADMRTIFSHLLPTAESFLFSFFYFVFPVVVFSDGLGPLLTFIIIICLPDLPSEKPLSVPVKRMSAID